MQADGWGRGGGRGAKREDRKEKNKNKNKNVYFPSPIIHTVIDITVTLKINHSQPAGCVHH